MSGAAILCYRVRLLPIQLCRGESHIDRLNPWSQSRQNSFGGSRNQSTTRSIKQQYLDASYSPTSKLSGPPRQCSQGAISTIKFKRRPERTPPAPVRCSALVRRPLHAHKSLLLVSRESKASAQAGRSQTRKRPQQQTRKAKVR